MIMNFKNIHIGQMMEILVTESGIELSRICNFLKCTEEEISEIYQSKSLDTEVLLKWSKLLGYDFFRVYSQHLILYAPSSATEQKLENTKTKLPQFRKNIYTKEVIDFILEQISLGNMTKKQVIERYRIPKTTLYKWISKYGNSKN
jgi:DNA-binding NtrC family response regulator